MTTLVTGAGLIGTAFARHAIERGESVIFLDSRPRDAFLRVQLGEDARYELVEADVRDLQALVDAMRAHAIDVVVHTAGLIGRRVADSLHTAFHVNVQGTANVAEAVRLTGVRRLVQVSSFGVYDWRQTANAPVTESFPRGNGGAYASFNLAKEAVVEAYARRCGFELAVLRPASVFGLGHFWSGSGGGKRIHDLVLGGLAGARVEIRSDDTGANEYVYAKDVGAAIDRAAVVALPSPSFINIGSGRLTPFDAVVEATRKSISALQVVIDRHGRTEGKLQHLDIAAAKRLLGWEPAYSLETALADYVDDVRRLGLDSLDLLQR